MGKQTKDRSVKTDSVKKNQPQEVGGLPYNLKRELEEISKNSGWVIDFTLPISELEDICNKANNPPSSWRNRWE